MKNNLKIKRIKKQDVNYLAELHYANIKYSLLTVLGLESLKNNYYELISNSNNFGYFAIVEKEIVGAIVVSIEKHKVKVDLNSIYKNIKFKNVLYFFFNILLNRIYKLFFLFKDTNKNLAEIYLIAVNENYRGQKIGTELIKASIKKLKELKIKQLITSSNNVDLIKYYLKNYECKIMNTNKYIGYKITTILIKI